MKAVAIILFALGCVILIGCLVLIWAHVTVWIGSLFSDMDLDDYSPGLYDEEDW
jgi:hypothetical protein